MKVYITNNPLVNEKIANDKYNYVDFLDGKTYIDVLLRCRNLIHKGYILKTHPLTSSIKPNETPFKSVVLQKREGDVHLNSLEIIENSIAVFEKFQNSKKTPIYIDKVNEDFMLIDYDIIKN